jgi:hypothetical protein
MRHRAVEKFSYEAGDTIARPGGASRAGWFRLSLAALTLFFAASGAVANSEASLSAQTVGLEISAPPAALDPASAEGSFEVPRFDPGEARPSATDQEKSFSLVRRPHLAALLAIRSSSSGSSTEKTTDEVLADAIALGPRPELEPKDPFRKRKLDLFRTVHPVSIGNADLVFRFRVRGNMREMMSLDVCF